MAPRDSTPGDSNTCRVPAGILTREQPSTAVSLPVCAIARRRASPSRSFWIATASASSPLGETRHPVALPPTGSAMPPTLDATTGRELIIASRVVHGNSQEAARAQEQPDVARRSGITVFLTTSPAEPPRMCTLMYGAASPCIALSSIRCAHPNESLNGHDSASGSFQETIALQTQESGFLPARGPCLGCPDAR